MLLVDSSNVLALLASESEKRRRVRSPSGMESNGINSNAQVCSKLDNTFW